MKTVSMGVNQRDKKLLVILAAAIIIFLLYNYVINPALINGADLSAEVKAAEAQMDRINTLIEQRPALSDEEAQEKKRLAEKYRMFFDDLNQERMLYKLDALLVGSGFNISSYALTKTAAAEISASVPVYAPLDYPLLGLASKANPSLTEETASAGESRPSAGAGEGAAGAIPATDLTLSFNNASYESVTAFLKAAEDMDKSLIVKNITMSKSESGIGGTVILSLYSLPKLDDADKDLLKFTPVIPKGKTNPFN